jgi:hypothetical protein
MQLDSFDVILGRNGMGFLSNTFRQLLTVLAVMFSSPGLGRMMIRDKHVRQDGP